MKRKERKRKVIGTDMGKQVVGWEITGNYMVYFLSDKNVLKLIVVMVYNSVNKLKTPGLCTLNERIV
jgi:hypothetical protein